MNNSIKYKSIIIDNKVLCKGDENNNHPAIYIKFPKDKNEAICIYCGKKFTKNDEK